MARSSASVCTRVVAVAAIGLGLLATAHAQQNPPASAPVAPAQQAPKPPTGPLAPEKYKNIQVLKDLPAAQLHDTMVYMEAAIGGNCQSCHVRNQAGDFEFDKDDRPNKKTTREMVALTRLINAQKAKGAEGVNCTTCHQGRSEPISIPRLAEMLTPEQLAARAAQLQAQAQGGGRGAEGRGRGAEGGGRAAEGGGRGAEGGGRGAEGAGRGQEGGGQGNRPKPPAETMAQVTDKLIQAMGGADAVQKITSRIAKGTMTDKFGQTTAITIEETSAGAFRVATDGPQVNVKAFDGKAGWTQSGDKVRELEGVEETIISMAADVTLPLRFKDRYQGLQVRAYGKVNGKDVIVAQGRISPSVTEILSFDKNAGFLLRRVVRMTTALGGLTAQIDYADFRPAGGVVLPFEIKVTNWEAVSTQKFADIKLNQPIAASRFAMPAPKAGQ